MKTTTFLLVLLLMCVLMPGVTHGQCQIQTSTNYAVSYSAAPNSTGTDIISSVVVDGSASMQIESGCPVSSMYTQFQNELPNITHSPSVLNQVGSVGGWTSGPSFCAECYGSYQSNVDSGPVSPGQQLNFSYGGSIYCSVAGNIFSVGSPTGTLRIGVSNYLYVGTSGAFCTYKLYCVSGTASCGYPSIQVETPCGTNYFVAYYIVYRTGVNSKCFPASIGRFSLTPVPCA